MCIGLGFVFFLMMLSRSWFAIRDLQTANEVQQMACVQLLICLLLCWCSLLAACRLRPHCMRVHGLKASTWTPQSTVWMCYPWSHPRVTLPWTQSPVASLYAHASAATCACLSGPC